MAVLLLLVLINGYMEAQKQSVETLKTARLLGTSVGSVWKSQSLRSLFLFVIHIKTQVSPVKDSRNHTSTKPDSICDTTHTCLNVPGHAKSLWNKILPCFGFILIPWNCSLYVFNIYAILMHYPGQTNSCSGIHLLQATLTPPLLPYQQLSCSLQRSK